MEKESIILVSIVILVLIAGMVFGLWKKEKQKDLELKKENIVNIENVKENLENVDSEVIYKNVIFIDGEISVSFNIPENWLVETRNSGEKEMTTEEMRTYLATNWREDIRNNPKITSNYTDLPWDMLKNLTRAEMEKMFENRSQIFPYKKSFPNASLALENGIITYVDQNADQVDFNIVDIQNEKFQKAIIDYKEYYLNSDIHKISDFLEREIDGFKTKVFYSKTGKDEEGNPIFTLNSSGSSMYFIEIKTDRIDKILIIWKQAEWRQEDENNFNNLINTLDIEIN